jgi:Zn-finger nucleic acid-binding protein
MVGNVEIDFCTDGCKGIWFDEGELKKVRTSETEDETISEIQGQFVPKPKQEAINEDSKMCPRCNVELYRYNWDMKSDIFLDSCEQCNGMWVDAGELKGMNEYLKNMAARPMPNEEEIQVKLAKIEQSAAQQIDANRRESINQVVDWDLWLFDDMIRFMMNKLTR